ncbi:siderophore-interacting protein [Microbacterium oleivorans]|uniref:siderophore-interacting protein n=1 Tax=Microbacterium oleivorans TaxID=273677 RepID=UPI00203E4AC9|nr:siderophore-interacting protein [Microbacterium oleivorans]MCM3695547.1 siderophore-interacting protein [Microbacterium oleivorans]
MSFVKSAPSFRLDRQPLDLRFRRAVLAARTWETPTFVRVRLEGDDLRGFTSLGSDDHMRLFFPDDPAADLDAIRQSPSREYTPLAWDAEAGWLEVEFAVHGDQGVAAPWAASAPLGSTIGVGGPRGSMLVSGRPDAWFLAGDETAVPAIRRFAGLMDEDAVGRILIEVTDAAHELPIPAPRGVDVSSVHRGAALPGTALAAALDALSPANRPEGDVFGFVAAEQGVVKSGRRLLLERWALASDQIVVKGYWKSGEAEYHAPH